MGIGWHIHAEVVTEEIAFPMGVRVPSQVVVRLGIHAFASVGRRAIFLTIIEPFFTAERQSGQGCRHRQEPDRLDRSNHS